MLVANREQLRGRGGAAHGVEKCPLGIHGLADEIEVFLHLVHVGELRNALVPGAREEVHDVGVHIAQRRREHGLARDFLADLAKDPRIADGMTPDHQAGGARLGEDADSGVGRRDVSVGDDGAGD